MAPDDRGMAVADIFRLEGVKAVEHWDVLQPVPETQPTTTRCSEACARAAAVTRVLPRLPLEASLCIASLRSAHVATGADRREPGFT